MIEVKGKYKNGIVVLNEMPNAEDDTEVLVVFPAASGKIPFMPVKQFMKLSGIVRLGGNAVQECETLYE